jgi:hypothetical protein
MCANPANLNHHAGDIVLEPLLDGLGSRFSIQRPTRTTHQDTEQYEEPFLVQMTISSKQRCYFFPHGIERFASFPSVDIKNYSSSLTFAPPEDAGIRTQPGAKE